MNEAKKLVSELLEAWREADYHWASQFGPVPPDWDEWTPENKELVRRVKKFLGEG